MGAPTVGSIVRVRVSATKIRPALIVADSGQYHWLVCQITSSAYGDPLAVEIEDAHFSQGSLQIKSYVRPNKLFTMNVNLIVSSPARLKDEYTETIIRTIMALLERSIPR
jgi:mRNA interferase MazF